MDVSRLNGLSVGVRDGHLLGVVEIVAVLELVVWCMWLLLGPFWVAILYAVGSVVAGSGNPLASLIVYLLFTLYYYVVCC